MIDKRSYTSTRTSTIALARRIRKDKTFRDNSADSLTGQQNCLGTKSTKRQNVSRQYRRLAYRTTKL